MAIYCLEDDSNIRELMVYTLDLAGFEVADTGIGIPESDYDRIFERFYQVDKSHSREVSGTGLGLAIVQYAVGTHNGSIHVESVENAGSTFTVTLPKA